MRKLALAVAAATLFAIVGSVSWQSEATTLTSGASALAVLKGYSTAEKVGCVFGTSRCPAGTKWQCIRTAAPAGEVKKCLCRPC